jgi:class 3 adenylate cyclase
MTGRGGGSHSRPAAPVAAERATLVFAHNPGNRPSSPARSRKPAMSAADRPGTVAGVRAAMLFTDIEGSTRMAVSLGRAWPSVFEDHHRLLSAAIERHHGRIESRAGDAVFALFARAVDAVAAATAAQAALKHHGWPEAQPVRVRMGIHVGELWRTPSGVKVGLDIHLAARAAAAANGGQVLLTRAARAAVPGVEIEDVGLYRLKGFPAPECLFHLDLDGGSGNCMSESGCRTRQ